jgi:hypothetical protein
LIFVKKSRAGSALRRRSRSAGCAPSSAPVRVKAGDKIKFEPDRVNGQFTVKKIERAK